MRISANGLSDEATGCDSHDASSVIGVYFGGRSGETGSIITKETEDDVKNRSLDKSEMPDHVKTIEGLLNLALMGWK